MHPQTIRQMFMRHHRLSALVIALALAAGCRSERPLAATPDMATAANAAATADAAAAQQGGPQANPSTDHTSAMEAAVDAAPPTASPPATAAGEPAGGVELAPDAPQSYVVKRHDTLWGIAKVFLRDPWDWPEIWQVNPQIHNPHLIYPGDTLRLVYIDGRPKVVLQRAQVERGGEVRVVPRVRSTPLAAAVTTIPYETVAAFMSKPSVLSAEEISRAPYILASLDDHAAIAEGNTIYARGFKTPTKIGTTFSIVRVGDALRDPDSHDILGYNGIFAGTARVTRVGDPTTLVMTESSREAEPGDKVLAGSMDVPLDFIPSAPQNKIVGRIMAVNDGVTLIGQYEVVVIDRGARDGLVPGDVLAVYKAGEVVRDNEKNGFLQGTATFFAPKVRLPDERIGTFMVFKTFDRISYGLIMEAQNIIRVADRVESP